MRRQRDIPFKLIMVLLISGIALVAGFSLWALRMMRHRQYHMTAAGEVLETGTAMAMQLSEQPEVKAAGDVQNWQHFENLLHSLWTVEHALQYVAVTEKGVVLFHRQAEATTSSRDVAASPRTVQDVTDNVQLERKTLRLGTNDIPMVTFTRTIRLADGTARSVEVALRQESVARVASGPVAATTAMFHVAVVTVAVAFGFCVALVLWVMRREDAAETYRREQEHLAFAGAIASGVVHDFRNPLSSVKLDIQMLREEAGNREHDTAQALTELADHAIHTADRMEEILGQFLSLSTPREEVREPLDLVACVRECLRMLEPRLTRHGVRVHVDMPSVNVFVHAYATSLRRAILNVLTNAEQHSPSGGWIALRLHTVKSRVILEVEDSGPGVPKEDWKRVFAMFVSGRPGGTGLGLFLAKTAIERCDGTIEVVGSASGGCCFRITLGLAPGPKEDVFA